MLQSVNGTFEFWLVGFRGTVVVWYAFFETYILVQYRRRKKGKTEDGTTNQPNKPSKEDKQTNHHEERTTYMIVTVIE